MSATAVLANPSRRNGASAVAMIRARVSSGLVLTCGYTDADSRLRLRLTSDEFSNSSLGDCQPLFHGTPITPACMEAGPDPADRSKAADRPPSGPDCAAATAASPAGGRPLGRAGRREPRERAPPVRLPRPRC